RHKPVTAFSSVNLIIMSHFEGDFQDISEGQLKFIKNVIEEKGFKDSKVVFAPAGAAGDNYVANVKRIKVQGENGQLSIIAKIAPTNELVRKRVNATTMFGNEHLIYTEFLPKLLQLQKQVGTTDEDLVKFPKCYGTNVEAPNEVILLEDLRELGFSMQDRLKSLSDECVSSVLKKLAIYHSLSYVLKSKEPDTYNYFKDNLRDMWGAMADLPKEELAYFSQLEEFTMQMLDDPQYKKHIKNSISVIAPRAAKMSKLENGSRYAVIQHGDAWTNNIMFKFEANYQIAKSSSPAYDFLYMIFNCTDHETRVKNFYNWLDYYHSELDKSLSNYGLKANYVYPRDQLDADLKRYGKLQFGCSILLCNVLSAKPEDAAKFKEGMERESVDRTIDPKKKLDVDTKERLKKRITSVIDSYIEFGLLRICVRKYWKQNSGINTKFNLDGNFEDVTEKQLEFINKVIEELGFKGSKVTFAAAGAAGDNYAANVKRVKVEGEKGSLSIIAKIAPINEVVRHRLNAALSFCNEHLMYTEYLPKLLKLQKDAGIPEDEQIKFPKCYGTNIEAPHEVILLEDLKVEGFTIMNRMKSLSNECVTIVY
ncbi:hypothetical protein HW555_002118, partial [Spodoptera exigua]